MITRHEIRYENNEQVLYFYFDFNYEMGSFTNTQKEYTILQKLLNYIKEKEIIFKGTKVILIVGGIIVGTLLFQPNENNIEFILSGNVPKEIIKVEKDNIENVILPKEITVNPPKEATKINTPTTIPKNNQTTIPKTNTSSIPTKTTTQPTGQTPSTTTPSTTVPSTPPPSSNPVTPPSTTEPVEEPVKIVQPVTIHRSNGSVITLEMEEYLIGVVSAEMPASFSTEALKAQAVAARTYTLKAISQGKRLTDTVSTQAYEDNNQLKAKWGSTYSTYYEKVKSAVNSTKGVYMTYNGKYIDAVYHSTNNGYTEDSLIVWGNNIPYLKTVDSHWDISASSYLRTIYKDIQNVSNILGVDINETTVISVLDRDISNHIVTMSIGGKTFSGIQLRSLLGLRSTDFDMTVSGEQVTLTTRGYGHAVGLSQYGANGMAKEGYTYTQILRHYYTGISINS